jgi:hypothetical protein
VRSLPDKPRGRPAPDGLHDTTSTAVIVADRPDIAAVLALSDERDGWMRRIAEAYRDGFDDGRATACVNLAVMEEHREKRRYWNEWWAKVWRIIRNFDSPDARMSQVMAEIAADQRFVAEALRLRAEKMTCIGPAEVVGG